MNHSGISIVIIITISATPGGEKLEDERLVAAAKKGNSKAFGTLVDRYHNQLYFTALGILRSGWDALDVCQETFLKAFSSIDTLKDNTKFKAWITKILINKSNDHLRKSKKTVLVENFIEDVKSQGFFENFVFFFKQKTAYEVTR